MVLTYEISPPSVTGDAGEPSDAVWFGEWTIRSWFPTNNSSTSRYQDAGVDLSTLTGPTQEQFIVPIVFGSTVNVETGQQIGIGWSANTAGPTDANVTLDPTEVLTGVQLFDSNGGSVTGFTITDDVGDTIGPNGVTPEPSTWLSMGTGVLIFWGVIRRHRSLRTSVPTS
jgi:hypothetical protein